MILYKMGMTLANTSRVIKQNTLCQRLCSDRQQKSNVLAYMTPIRLVVLFVDRTVKKINLTESDVYKVIPTTSNPIKIRLKKKKKYVFPKHNAYVTSHKMRNIVSSYVRIHCTMNERINQQFWMQYLHECASWFEHCGEITWWTWAEAKFPVFHPLFPRWQLLSDVVWKSLMASCWRLHHCWSNWCRHTRYLLTRPKQTDQILFLAKWQPGWSVLKFASEKQDLCAVWTKATQPFYTLLKALNMIQIFQTDFLSCGEYGNGRKRKLHYENHLLINTQSYWIQPSHNQRNNRPLANVSELLYCGCVMWLSFHFLTQILRRLAGEQSQQAKLAGCLHHFIVCAPSKDLSRSPNTSQLMIKHQGQDNVSECRCWETLRLMKIFQGLCAPWPIADGFWKCHSPVAEILHAGDTANTKVWIGCGMHNSQANKNFPWAICRLGDSWLAVMSGEMRMCLDVQYFHLYVKDRNMKFQSRGEKMDDTSTYRERDCPDNTLRDVSS